MATGILEIASVATPKRFLSGLDNEGAGLFGLRHHAVNFCFGSNVVAERELGRAGRLRGQASSANEADGLRRDTRRQGDGGRPLPFAR
jgi:hypothetical protein